MGLLMGRIKTGEGHLIDISLQQGDAHPGRPFIAQGALSPHDVASRSRQTAGAEYDVPIARFHSPVAAVCRERDATSCGDSAPGQ